MAGWDHAELDELEAIRDEDDAWPAAFGPRLVLVCRCHCVEEREIEALAAQGCDVAEIARRTGATTGCGSCLLQVEEIVRCTRRVG
ncbi:bacterioferritin-associated ferredoxin [Vulgatibacter sp.]|uniref:(2Fe-2S)-binding protein n=1 Tax=Vulgatibacter sp. TaxID=1971226 RepID=UPI003563CFB8